MPWRKIDPKLVEMNVARYRELLKVETDEQKRATIERLLAQALAQQAERAR